MADIEIGYDPRTEPPTPVIRFTAAFMENELIKQAGGSWNPKGANGSGFWQAPLTWATCIRARGVFGSSLHVGLALNDWSTREYHRISQALTVREDPGDSDTLTGIATRMYPHQYQGTTFLAHAPEALLADDMGTGKTATLLSALSRVNGLPAVVVCPVAVRRNWVTEAAEWLPEATPYEVKGTATQRTKILTQAASDPSALVIVNYEAVRSHSRLAPYGSVKLTACRQCDSSGDPDLTPAKCQRHVKELNQIPFRTFIADEAHRIKDPQSLQTRAVWAVAHNPTVQYRWAATGTPIANHPGDLWGILHCVSPKQFPAKTRYIDRYCQTSFNPFGGMDIIGLRSDTKDEFFKIFHPMFRRMRKEKILPFLPPKVYSIRYSEMTPKQAKAYKEMENTFTAELGEDWLTAPDHLTASGRLMQFASAHAEMYEKTVRVRQPDGTMQDEIQPAVRLLSPSNKVNTFMEIVEELGKDYPFVACAQSRQLIEMASQQLSKENIPHVLITGAQTSEERVKALEDFQTGKVNILLFTIQAGGTGLTMTRADTMIRLQRSWSMIDDKQAEDRIHRIGSERHSSVHIIDIIAPGTIEERQVEAIQHKQNMSDEVTDA